jgi:mono/diheme cytochrome c family protein
MPAFAGTLTEPQIEQIRAFVQATVDAVRPR